MKIIESVLEFNGNREFIKKVYKHYAEQQLEWGNWNIYIGDEILECIDPESRYFYIENPFNSYEAFLKDEDCERDDWLFENDLSWCETLDSFVEDMFECDLGEYIYLDDVDEFQERIDDIFKQTGAKCTWDEMYEDFLGNLSERLCKNVKKALKIDYRKAKNETSVEMFSGMISGYFNEDEFYEYDSDYKFNNFNFNFHQNFDLACKFIDNTLSMADKAEAIILFNDIKERLIAA